MVAKKPQEGAFAGSTDIINDILTRVKTRQGSVYQSV